MEVPSILDMEVDDNTAIESEYRVRCGRSVKYLTIAGGTFDRDTLSFPLSHLPPITYHDSDWTTAHISRDAQTGQLKVLLSNEGLAGVQNIWHQGLFDVLDLKKIKRIGRGIFEAEVSGPTASPMSPAAKKVIAKTARFHWEILYIERETRAYQVLKEKDSNLSPAFLGHVHENGRVIGFLLEKLENRRRASVEDLEKCAKALTEFHSYGLLHGDVNRHNFLVGRDDVKLIDLECFEENASQFAQTAELETLPKNLLTSLEEEEDLSSRILRTQRRNERV